MPKVLHRKLKKTARKRGYGKERAARYIYGTMQKVTDWKPGKKLKRKKRQKK